MDTAWGRWRLLAACSDAAKRGLAPRWEKLDTAARAGTAARGHYSRSSLSRVVRPYKASAGVVASSTTHSPRGPHASAIQRPHPSVGPPTARDPQRSPWMYHPGLAASALRQRVRSACARIYVLNFLSRSASLVSACFGIGLGPSTRSLYARVSVARGRKRRCRLWRFSAVCRSGPAR